MANPQREHGHLDIANEIVDRLQSYRLDGREWQILWVILRKTWGWIDKKTEEKLKVAAIPLSEFEKRTGIKRHKCQEVLKRLIEKNIIIKTQTPRVAGEKNVKIKGKKVKIKGVPLQGNSWVATYGFQKDYDKWRCSPAREQFPYKGTVKCSPTREQKCSPTREQLPLKETSKETIKETPPISPPIGGAPPEKKKTKPQLHIETVKNAVIPENLRHNGFVDVWAEFCSDRFDRQKYMTPIGAKNLLSKLSKHGEEVATLALQESLSNGWTGVFPEKINQKPPNRRGRANQRLLNNLIAAEEFLNEE